METIPVSAIANQSFQVVLGDQDCSFRLYTRPERAGGPLRLYMDLYVGETAIFYGALCKDGVLLPLSGYMAFEGGLLFVDMEGSDDPEYTGLGDRWNLLYLTQTEADAYRSGEYVGRS